MSKDTRRGKKVKGRPRSSNKIADPPPAPAPVEPTPSRVQRTKDWVRSVGKKAVHDLAAHYLKRAMILFITGTVGVGSYNYFGWDYRNWLRWVQHPQIETGSIVPPRAPADQDARKREIECNVARAREVDKATERRRAAWAVYDKFKQEWQPGWIDKRTAEDACAPHLIPYRQLAQEVRDKESKDCSAPSAK